MQEKANKKKTRSQAQQQEEELIKKEKKTKKKHEQVGVSNPLEIQSDVAPCGACRS